MHSEWSKIIPLMELFNHTIESKKSLYDLVVVDISGSDVKYDVVRSFGELFDVITK